MAGSGPIVATSLQYRSPTLITNAPVTMISGYIRIALRRISRHPLSSAINIAGLSVGIACCILMLLYVQDEMTFDTFHEGSRTIYRILSTREQPDHQHRTLPFTMGTLGPALAREVPGVTLTTRVLDSWSLGRFTVGYGDKKFYEGDYLLADEHFLDMFSFAMIDGDGSMALREPNSVVLTKEAAQKYFGTGDPTGKTLSVERLGDARVTGVLQTLPDNSHLQFSMIFSMNTLEHNPGWRKYENSWTSDGFITYVRTVENVSEQDLQSHLTDLVRSRKGAMEDGVTALTIQPLREIHFGSGAVEADRNSGKSTSAQVLAFGLIAIFIALIACINYSNLATARSLTRGREIGMRKVAGANRRQLVFQVLGESVLLALLGLIVALALAEFVLPQFNHLTGKHLSLNLIENLQLTGFIVGLTLVVGLLSGAYPAVSLARMSPIRTLRGVHGASGTTLRRLLVVLQFTVSIVMIVITLVAVRQLEYVRTKDLGFRSEHLVVVDINSSNTRRSFEAIKREMSALPGVASVSVSSRVPGEWKTIADVDVSPSGGNAHTTSSFIGVDQDFLRTFGIQLLEGRNLSGIRGADTQSVLINETAARQFGWEHPVGRELDIPGAQFHPRVVGVVRDFHFRSLHEPIGPLLLGHWNNPVQVIDYFTLRVRVTDYPSFLASLKRIHREFDTVTPLEYNFLNERIEDFYIQDRRAEGIFSIASLLAIAIACLGLLGLSSFAAEQRRKEIGVRKVLGASVPGLLAYLSRDFALLVGFAIVLATPISYVLVNAWLQDFAYRIAVGPSVYLLAGGAAMVIALCVVAAQIYRAAASDPVTSLRYE